MADVCITPFCSERDKNSFVLVTVHKDEMENNDPSPKVSSSDVNESKRKSQLLSDGFETSRH